jgi:membrane-associated phospholipid phosphatase
MSVAGVGWTAFFAMAVWMSRSGEPTTLDNTVLAAMVAVRTTVLDAAATALTDLGSYRVVAVVTVVIAGILLWRTRNLLLPLTLVITMVETSSIVYLTKEIVGRARPPIAFVVGPPAADPSFPSGHTTSGSVVWVLGALLVASTLTQRWARRVVTAVGVALAIVIGLTRSYLGYHWATDVLGGWLLAAGICATAIYLAIRMRPHADSLTLSRRDPFSDASVVDATSRQSSDHRGIVRTTDTSAP